MATYPRFTGTEPCTKNPDIFFWDPESPDFTMKEMGAAKALCAKCPMLTECRDWAVRVETEYGIWGGMTVNERKKYRHQNRIPSERRSYGIEYFLKARS